MTKYELLTSALITAKAAANQHNNDDDGGTCNFDTAYIRLPRWHRQQTIKAFANAGLRTDVWNIFGGSAYMILGCYTGQGDRRTNQAEAIRETMQAAGYDCHIYYQMD